MRLLLDEQHDRHVAIQLRERGHDVVAVSERPELTGLDDPEVLAAAAAERRALVTENVRHFAVAHRRLVEAGGEHYGIVFTSPTRFPRTRTARGALVAALDRFLGAHRADDELLNLTEWL